MATSSEPVGASVQNGFPNSGEPDRRPFKHEGTGALCQEVDSDWRLDVAGWPRKKYAESAPESDGACKVVSFQLRRPCTRGFAVKGARRALFIPGDFSIGATWTQWTDRTVHLGNPLFVFGAEGASDCAAPLDGACQALEQPSCCPRVHALCRNMRRLRPPCVVVFADSEAPVTKGARKRVPIPRQFAKDARLVRPPPEFTGVRT